MHFIGIDISADDFAASIFTSVNKPIISEEGFDNNPSGFEAFLSWLKTHGISTEYSIICMEATGVYGEAISYWLVARGFKTVLEHPLKVKRAFLSKGHKTDKIDSKKIAEYAYRHVDKLKFWTPPEKIIEQIKVLLSTREQFVKQRTANNNALKALKRKKIQTPLANRLYKDTINRLDKQIEQIEKELRKLIDNDSFFKNTVHNLEAIPGVGLLLTANFLVATNGFTIEMATNYKKFAAFLGVCPYQYESGSSIYRKPTSAKSGPSRMRKLLHLASRSNMVHNSSFSLYASIKLSQGKNNRIILNNMCNKLLKIMCAIVRTGKPYVNNYVSKHPKFA
jgi:transposase